MYVCMHLCINIEASLLGGNVLYIHIHIYIQREREKSFGRKLSPTALAACWSLPLLPAVLVLSGSRAHLVHFSVAAIQP